MKNSPIKNPWIIAASMAAVFAAVAFATDGNKNSAPLNQDDRSIMDHLRERMNPNPERHWIP